MLSLGNNSSEESPDTIPDLLQLVISSPVNGPSTTCVLTYSTPVFLRSFSLLPHIFSSTKPPPSSTNPASAEIISEVAELFLELQSIRLEDINGIGGSGTCTSFFAVQTVLSLLCLETSSPARNCKCWVEDGESGGEGALSCKLEY